MPTSRRDDERCLATLENDNNARFKIHIGGIGRDGYRHPPSIVTNLPHLDIPKKGLKHWPWRRKLKNDKNDS